MKVLLVYTDIYENDNQFVRTLKNGLESVGCHVDLGLEKFWLKYESYDIIHLQWPEAIFNWKEVSKRDLAKLSSHILNLKIKKKKIVYTRHNIKPHYSTNKNKIKLYEIIEANCDAIFHMGRNSIEQFKRNTTNNDVLHFIIPHHTYDELYPLNISKEIAREKLNFLPNKFIFLCFGAFRDDKERNMVIKSFSKLHYPDKLLVAPRFYNYSIDPIHPRASLKGIIERIKYKKHSKDRILSSLFVEDEMLPFYFSAADVIFIQRCEILNSGNLTMAFHFGKTVIGPNIGNIGEILEETGNITFNPYDTTTIVNAMSKGIEKAYSDQGLKNKIYATEKLTTHYISKKIKDIYFSILN